MPTFNAATDAPEYVLPEPGAYIATCIEILDAPDKGFGPGVKWVFHLMDPHSGVTLHNADDEPEECWQFTSVKMSPKARARPFVEALLGRPVNVDGREVPDIRQLIGRSMFTILIHEPRDDGSQTVRLTSCKPYAPPATAAVTAPGPGPGATPTSDRDTLLAELRTSIQKTEILGTKKHLDWMAMTIESLSDDELSAVLSAVRQDILDS